MSERFHTRETTDFEMFNPPVLSTLKTKQRQSIETRP